jgi:hypothetical protein
MSEWIDIAASGELPQENARVTVAVQNGNFCHRMDDCYYSAGAWFKDSGEKLPHGVDVYAWSRRAEKEEG